MANALKFETRNERIGQIVLASPKNTEKANETAHRVFERRWETCQPIDGQTFCVKRLIY